MVFLQLIKDPVVTELIAMLWSISPLGEAKVGIPYAIFNGVNVYLSFFICFFANILIYPAMTWFLDTLNSIFLRWLPYKKAAFYIARKAKFGAGNGVKKYGFWGLMLFVLIPLPGSGVYAGTIAAYIFRMERKKAFLANSLGIFFSSVIIWGLTMLTFKGIN